MGDILPPKKQAIVVERLRRRIEDYRQHHGLCFPRYERATNGINDQQHQTTLVLQQRFLEPKTKKTSKKNDHKKDNLQNSLGQKLLKRPADSPLDIGDPGFEDSDHHPSKIARTNNNNTNNGNQNLPQFHVEIVQQFTSSGSSQAQQIQTNVTVKALAGNVKSDSMLVSNTNGNSGTPKLSDQPPTSGVGPIECKQEPDLELDECLLGSGDGRNNGAPNLPDSLSTFPFMEDSSDEIIHPDTLNDLIAELTPDIMSDFNFDKFEDSNIEPAKEEHSDKDLSNSGSMTDMGKSLGNLPNQTQLQNSNQPPSFPSTPNPSTSPLFEGVPGGTGGMNSLGNMPPVSSSVVAQPPASRLPNYPSLGAGLGLDFNLKEPSPAAQTLKQMAEQHQNMQQKHQQFGLGMNSPHPRSPFGPDFGLPPTNQYNSTNNSGTQDFLNSSSSNNSTYLTKGSNQGMFPFGQGNLGPGMGKPSSLYPTSQPPSSLNSLSELEMRKRQVMQMQRISVDQKPNLGTPGSSGPGPLTSTNSSAPSNAPPPLGFGSTKPLSHFTEPIATSAPASNQSNMPQLQAPPFIRGPNPGSQFPSSARTPVRPSLQISQNQQMQITQNNQQLQVSQGQHIHLQEMSAATQAQQQQQGLFGFPTSNSDQFQLSVSQSQSVSFTASSAQYPGRTAQGSMNVGPSPMMNNAQFDKHDPILRQKIFQHQQMMRQQIEKQKLVQLQQQQQQHPQQQHPQQQHPQQQHSQQQHSQQQHPQQQHPQQQHPQQQHPQQRHPQQQPPASSNPSPNQMQFMSRPPPEYKPQQQTTPNSSPGLPPLATPNSIMSAMNPNSTFNQVSSLHPSSGGSSGCNRSSPLNELTMNQTSNLQTGPSRMLGPTGPSMQSHQMPNSIGSNLSGLGGTGPRFGGPPNAQQGSMVLSGVQGMGNARMNMNPNAKSMPFGSPLMRGHRPPNVNIGPDGLNIGQRGPPPGHDWRHMMIQNQRFAATSGKSVAGNPMTLQARIPFSNASSVAGFNSMQAATSNAGGLQMASMQQQQQVRLAMSGINRTNPPSGQIPNQTGSGMGLMPSASSMGMSRPTGPTAPVGNQANLSMQMSSSVNMSANMGSQNFMQSNNSVSSDFNLDFLDNIASSGLDGNASAGFSSSDATELLNTFDSVMQNNSASYMLDGGL